MEISPVLEAFIKILIVVLIILLPAVTFLGVWLERKLSAWIQNRIGPNRLGPYGLFQMFADIPKLFFKEDIVPAAANKFVHSLGPMISLTIAFSTFAVMPFGDTLPIVINGVTHNIKLQIADVNIALLYVLALSSLAVYGITLSGWSSNNKYSLLGGIRSSAQMISYELSLGLSIIGIVMLNNSLQLDEIVKAQGGYYLFGVLPNWNIFVQPIGFVTFVVAMFAETNRLPFDLPEAEPELVAGYHTEYTGMKFGMFMLSEYLAMFFAASMISTLYLGGWQVPYIEYLGLSPFAVSLLQVGAFFTKFVLIVVFFMVVRWSMPRFRYDQLMNLGWKVMLPLSLLNIALTGLFILKPILTWFN
ncbi:MAG: NADH-quinone oxidoreductase subunit NuoH [Bacteriovoracaceae bacterium]|nr:NADH-quinone oxidoreductase subunit NuoH [Bacteroidota bacterium]